MSLGTSGQRGRVEHHLPGQHPAIKLKIDEGDVRDEQCPV
jgi:hypothetical protein